MQRTYFRVSDEGIGLPKNLKFKKPDSSGLKLVKSLINQIGGTLKLDRNQGK